MGDSIGVAVAGFGYWGANLARNVVAAPNTHLVGIAEADRTRSDLACEMYPDAPMWQNLEGALADETLDAVILATPASTHGSLAYQTLDAGKNVLVEKPLTESIDDGVALVEMTASSGLTLMVGHTFLYSASVAHLRSWIKKGELGEIQYIHSRRLSFGRIRRDTNALWNFAPHDLSIMMHLLDELSVEVSGRGFSFIDHGIEDVAFATMRFASGVGANLHVSWIDPLKTRTMIVVGDEKMAIYNDVSVDQPLGSVEAEVSRSPAHCCRGGSSWQVVFVDQRLIDEIVEIAEEEGLEEIAVFDLFDLPAAMGASQAVGSTVVVRYGLTVARCGPRGRLIRSIAKYRQVRASI